MKMGCPGIDIPTPPSYLSNSSFDRTSHRKGACTVITTFSAIVFSLIALFVGAVILTWRTSWKPYKGEIEHDPREGNATMPPTYPGLEWLLSLYVWKTATIFEAREEGIYVGVAGGGRARTYKQFIAGNKFAMKLPREYRTYFAVKPDGRRVKIKEIERLVPVTDPRFERDIPLL